MGDEPLAIDIDSAEQPKAPGRVWCRLCGRPLTGAESRRTGLGPSCDAKLHPPGPDIRTRRHQVEQDPLPGIQGPFGVDGIQPFTGGAATDGHAPHPNGSDPGTTPE